MASNHDPYEKIEKIDKVSSKEKAESLTEFAEPETRVPPNKEKFDALVGNTQVNNEVEATGRRVETTGKVSLMDEIANVGRRVDRITPTELVAQAQEVIGKIEELKGKLNTPNLEIKSSMQETLQNKLSHIDENLKVALSRAGVEYRIPENQAKTSANPIDRFLGFLTDGQSKLESLSLDLSKMGNNKEAFSPASMLLIQLKVGFVQQEIELFTSLLNKSLESTKTIMNVQV
jgi:uncharacterized OsmC-like protein